MEAASVGGLVLSASCPTERRPNGPTTRSRPQSIADVLTSAITTVANIAFLHHGYIRGGGSGSATAHANRAQALAVVFAAAHESGHGPIRNLAAMPRYVWSQGQPGLSADVAERSDSDPKRTRHPRWPMSVRRSGLSADSVRWSGNDRFRQASPQFSAPQLDHCTPLGARTKNARP